MKSSLLGFLVACFVNGIVSDLTGGTVQVVTQIPIGSLCGGSDPGTCQVRGNCSSPNVVLDNCRELNYNGADLDCCQNNIIGGGTIRGPGPSFIVSAPRGTRSPNMGPVRETINIFVSPNIGQLKFTLKTFDLPNPSVTGECDYKNSIMFSANQMQRGIFGPGVNSLCGENTGQHFYLPVTSGETVQVLVNIQGYGNAPPQSRKFASYESEYRILVEFIPINHMLAAPDGCLQYFTEGHGRITSFNFDGHSNLPWNQDYLICIRPKTEMAIGLTFRAETFAMPTNESCVNGENIIFQTAVPLNNQVFLQGRVCCSENNANSGYVSYTGYQKDGNSQSLRRYWCGDKLGPENGMSGSGYDVRVVSGQNWSTTLNYEPVGFKIDYKVDIGVF